MKAIFLTGLAALCLIVAACGSTEEQKAEGPIRDDLTGLDTTRPLISEADLAETRDLILVPYRENGKWGFADASMKVVVPVKYDQVFPFKEGLAVVIRDSSYGMVDKRGREVIPPTYNRITESACGVIALKVGSDYVLVNREGKRINDEVYEGVLPYTCSDERIPVMRGGKVAFLDNRGRQMTGFDYERIYGFRHGVAPVMKDGRWGLIDREGRKRGSFDYAGILPFESGLGVALKMDSAGNEKWGVLDSMGNVLIPFEYGYISGTFSGKHVVCWKYDPLEFTKKNNVGKSNPAMIFDREGKMTGRTELELWDDFSEGLVVAEKDGKFGFADHSGTLKIPAEYDWACGFKMGMAWVQKGEYYGFINKAGEVVIPIRYHSAFDYVYMAEDGAKVVDPETGDLILVDKSGKEYRKK